MTKPIIHAKNSARKYGGKWKDYIEIHHFLDISKSSHPNMAHRAILHNSLGAFIIEKAFGYSIINSENREVSTRQIAEDHIIEDLGFIPTVSDYLNFIELQPWMCGSRTKKIPKSLIVD